jgi:subtilisin family serine protease
LYGQANRYVVSFTSKQGTAFSIERPHEFLSAKAMARRQRNGVALTDADLPVAHTFVENLRAAGAEVIFTSRWFNAALIQATPAQLPAIQSLPFVARVQLAAPGPRPQAGRTREVSKTKERFKEAAAAAPATRTQLQMLGLTTMIEEGYDGRGVDVAVFDSGFEGVSSLVFFRHLFQENRVKDQFDFVTRSADVFQLDDHGTEVLSIMAGMSAGSFMGGSPAAGFYLYLTEDIASEYRVEEWNWLFAAERADSAGVDMIVASLGYSTFDDASMNYSPSDLNGTTAVVSRAATEAANRGILVVVSAGNSGNDPRWRLVTPPADAMNVLAIGSVNANGVRSTFSSLGPTADGRIKPDLVALGSGTSLVRGSGAVSTGSGTSYAAPLVASLAAGAMQRFPDLSVAALTEAMLASATQGSSPDNQMGFGVPGYEEMVDFLRTKDIDDPIEIYPNPAENFVSVRIRHGLDENITITMTDTAGRIHLQHTVRIAGAFHPIEVDISHLAQGLYLFKVERANDARIIRLIKQ